jgi:hypothetical protein
MTTVLLAGRRLPHQDWEGDSFTPNGKYVTCTDTSAGRMVAYATNGRVVKDGRVYRAALRPPDPNGITLKQAQQAVRSVTGLRLIIPSAWDWPDVLAHLTAKRGLVIQGWYSGIPRQYRFQLAADFGHAMFASHYSPTAGIRVWDPLDPNTNHHGQWIPARHVRAFMEALSRREGVTSLFAAYVPLQPV